MDVKYQTQEQLLQSIHDTVPCGILRISKKNDGTYHLISINKSALYLLSYQDENECRADWKNGIVGSVLEEDYPALKHANEILQKVGDEVEVSYRARRVDGKVRWLRGFNTLVDATEDQMIIQRTMVDETERRLLQKQLELEQEMYRVAMESSSTSMYEYRIEEDLFIFYEPRQDNRGGKNVLRSEIPCYQEVLRRGKLVHPNDIRTVIENICHGRAEVFECRIIPAGESDYMWHRFTGKLVSGNGRPARVVGTMQNIQKEKDTLSANAQKLHMHQSALHALSSVYVCICYVVLAYDHFYGVRLPDARKIFIPRSGSFQDTLRIYMELYAHPDDLERLLPYADIDFLKKKLRTGKQLEVEFRHKKSETEIIWLRLEFHLISTENRIPKTIIAAFRDISDTRQKELEQRQAEAQAKRALEIAYASANQANQAKSDFLSRMSHDMRTPMNAIIGMTAIAEQNLNDPERLVDCLKKINISSRHLLESINEVLDMSKIESGNFSLNESAFDLSLLLHQTCEMFDFAVREKKHDLQVDVKSLKHSAVLGDSVRIQQILVNLLSNAVKYTPDGGLIRLTLMELPYPSSSVSRYTFTVEDNGIGMEPEFLEKIFLPFERAEDSRISKIQGTGLGMAITYNLVSLMAGSIQVESRPHKGTRFTVTISLKTTKEMSEQAIEVTSKTDLSKLKFQKQTRILLVEDNELNREIAREFLEMNGLLVEEAENGAIALDMFQNSAKGYYDLILMDIQMPVMNGYESTKIIRSLDREDAADIPIIALTANAFVEDVNQAKLAGMNEHLSKPLEIENLLKALARWLDK